MTLKDVSEGMEVLYHEGDDQYTECTIARIGRTFVYVEDKETKNRRKVDVGFRDILPRLVQKSRVEQQKDARLHTAARLAYFRDTKVTLKNPFA